MATYTSQYPTQDATHVKATTYYSSDFYPQFSTDPTKSLVGGFNGNQWVAADGKKKDQRFHIDLGLGFIIRRLYYHNGINSGTGNGIGVQDFTLWGSNEQSSFDALTYTTDTGWTEIMTAKSTFDIHVPLNIPDPKYIIVTNSVTYRYYAIKCATNWGHVYIGYRRIELQTEDGYSPTPPFVPEVFLPRKNAYTGFNCFTQQHIKNVIAGSKPFKLPTGPQYD